MIVLGVDPGARWAALAVRDRDRLLAHRTFRNAAKEIAPAPPDWLREVTQAVLGYRGAVDLVAVEGAWTPNPHVRKKLISPAIPMAVAQMVGAIQILDMGVPIVTVRPGKLGSLPLGFYPSDLVSDAERRKDGWKGRVGGGQRRHARSAWDVAGKGLQAHLAGVR